VAFDDAISADLTPEMFRQVMPVNGASTMLSGIAGLAGADIDPAELGCWRFTDIDNNLAWAVAD
jgi:hypothetical protein